jgi:Cu/Ag efflux protein CusF
MRSFIIPVAFAAVVATSSLAFAAAQQANGVIKAFDAKAMTLTLDDGTVYQLQKGFKDPGLKTGEKVAITWDMVNGQHMASQVTITK